MDCPECDSPMRAVLNEAGQTVGYFCDSCREYDSVIPAGNPEVRHARKQKLGAHEVWGALCPYDMQVRVYGDGTDYSRTAIEILESDHHCKMRGQHSIVVVRSVV